MKTHLTSSQLSAEEHRNTATGRAGAYSKQAPHTSMQDTRAASLAQLQHQEWAANSSQAVQLKARGEMMAGGSADASVQRVEDDELLQRKSAVAQCEEEEDLLQGKFAPVQRVDDEETLQAKSTARPTAQLEAMPNRTGMPDQLKAGIESLSGVSMDHVNVHYNSGKPAQLNAHAYAQGSEIHVGPGQEKHLPHEAWHIVQQSQGRVQPTAQAKGVAINDDRTLETEADAMGAKALQNNSVAQRQTSSSSATVAQAPEMVQLKAVGVSGGTFKDLDYRAQNGGGKLLTKGARMFLEFKPHEQLEATEVSLVQTTNSTLVNLTNPHVPDQPESLLNERRTPGGTAIDQQIFLAERKMQINPFKSVTKPEVVNLDPRYHEERHSVDEPLYDPRKNMFGGGQAAIEYTEAQKLESAALDRWRPATLKDEPGHSVPQGELLTGGETFEVAAMADGQMFLGSIRWGWKINDATQLAELDPDSIELVSEGAASAEFMAAADAWNAMPVTDPKTGAVYSTIQLPTPKRLANSKRVTMWVQGVLARYKNAEQHDFDQLTDFDFGEYLLTGQISSWERDADEDGAPRNKLLLSQTVNDLLKTYPQGEQYLEDLSTEQFGEFLVTGKIEAWEKWEH